MSINRRTFLRRAGMLTALGLGGSFVINGAVEAAAEYEPSKKGLFPNAKHLAMVVDMSKFKTEDDFNRVIQSCVSIHNIPDFGKDDLKDEIKWIWSDDYEHTFSGGDNDYLTDDFKKLPFMVACNHCENPPCVKACPTGATFKRPDGIVDMDFHRCIGCRFCMGACPFGARSFNYRDPRPFIKKIDPDYPTRTPGVVEKCIFCVERLADGLMPACVEASKGGLIFGDLDDHTSEVWKIVSSKFTIRRKTELGTQPSVYYLVGGESHA